MRRPPSLLSALSWLFLAASLAHADTSALGPEATRFRDEPHRGKLVPSGTWDGHFFFSLGDALPMPYSYRWRTAFLGRYTPSFWGLQARLALGGYHLSERPGTNNYEGIIASGYGIDELWLRYPFDLLSWTAAVQGGVFRWRSNPDALLMGEYLARMGAYPMAVVRPGDPGEALDSLTTALTGLRFSLASPEKSFSHEALALYDALGKEHQLSLLYSGSFTPARGVEVGGAVAFYSVATTREPFVYLARDPAGDTAAPMDTIRMDKQSTLFSARFAVDIATLITGQARRDRGGRLFAEAALLGWRNYPMLYDDRSQRYLLTAGLHLPAFGLLHALRFQTERVPMIWEYSDYALPIWLQGTSPALDPPTHIWLGQVYMSRAVLPWLDVQAWTQWELGEEGGTRDTTRNEFRTRWALQAELRLSARF